MEKTEGHAEHHAHHGHHHHHPPRSSRGGEAQPEHEHGHEHESYHHHSHAWSVHDLHAFERATSPEALHELAVFLDENHAVNEAVNHAEKFTPGSFVHQGFK